MKRHVTWKQFHNNWKFVTARPKYHKPKWRCITKKKLCLTVRNNYDMRYNMNLNCVWDLVNDSTGANDKKGLLGFLETLRAVGYRMMDRVVSPSDTQLPRVFILHFCVWETSNCYLCFWHSGVRRESWIITGVLGFRFLTLIS